MPPQTTTQQGGMTPPPSLASVTPTPTPTPEEEFTEAQLSDGRTLRFKGKLNPDEVGQKVNAFRAQESEIKEDSSGFWHWFFGVGPQYEHKGLVESGLRWAAEEGKAESQQRQHFRESKQYYDSVMDNYNKQLAALEASKDPEATKKFHRQLIEEEKESRLSGSALEQFGPQALQSAAKIATPMFTNLGGAIGLTAAAVPQTRPFIGAYFGVRGLIDAFRPRNEDPNDLDYESEPDYIERQLINASQVAGGAALMKAPSRTTAGQRRYRLDKATFAAGGGNPEFAATLDDLDRTLRESKGKVKSVADVGKLVEDTGKRLDQHREQALFPIRGQKMVPTQISNDLLAKAREPNLRNTPEGRKIANAYTKAAVSFQRPWSIQELDLEYNRLDKKTSPSDIDKIVKENIRDIVDSELNRRYPGQDFKSLRERREKLADLSDRLGKRVTALRDAQSMEKGGPFLMNERATGSLGKHGFFGRVYAKIPGAGPERAANVAAKRGFKQPGKGTELAPLKLRGGPTPPPAASPGGAPPPPAGAAPAGTPPTTPPPSAAPAGAQGQGPVLGPGAPGLSGTTRSINVNGQPVGHITYEASGDTIKIHDLGGSKVDYDAMANQLGPQGVSKMVQQLAADHPEAKFIEGIRVGGAKAGEGLTKRLPIERFTRSSGLESKLKESVSAAKKGEKVTPEETPAPAKMSFKDWTNRVQAALKYKGKVMADPAAIERIRNVDWRAMYEQGLAPPHAVNRAIKIATDPNYKPGSMTPPPRGDL